MAIFKKKRKVEDKVEARFQQVVDLFKDLDKREFKRLMKGVELTWEGYNEIRQVQTVDEKENAEMICSLDSADYKEI